MPPKPKHIKIEQSCTHRTTLFLGDCLGSIRILQRCPFPCISFFSYADKKTVKDTVCRDKRTGDYFFLKLNDTSALHYYNT